MPDLLAAARSLQLDLVAAEVGTALRDAGVAFILLRGPSLTRWLYPPHRGRLYVDVDLLLAPESVGAVAVTPRTRPPAVVT